MYDTHKGAEADDALLQQAGKDIYHWVETEARGRPRSPARRRGSTEQGI